MNESFYLTPQELAERFKVTERTIVGMARSGKIPAIRIGRLWRFRIEAIQAWEMDQGSVEIEAERIVDAITG